MAQRGIWRAAPPEVRLAAPGRHRRVTVSLPFQGPAPLTGQLVSSEIKRFTGRADVRLRVAYQFRPRRCHAGLGARDAGLECSCPGPSGLSGRLADLYQSAVPQRGCLRRAAEARSGANIPHLRPLPMAILNV
jgi:hypothetical protein